MIRTGLLYYAFAIAACTAPVAWGVFLLGDGGWQLPLTLSAIIFALGVPTVRSIKEQGR